MIPPEDLKVTTWPKQIGGQVCGVNNGIKLTHIPTDIEIYVGYERSQHKNRQLAIEGLEGILTSKHFIGSI